MPPRWKPPRPVVTQARREACVREVTRRARSRCERCGVPVSPNLPEWHPRRSQVNETRPRSLGGDPCDPLNCELVCQLCHFPNGQHAPTVERQRRLLGDVDLLSEKRWTR